MAIAKFTIEMAADLGQLKRDLAATQAVVADMGGKMAAGYTPVAAAVQKVAAAHTQAANQAVLGHMAQQKSARLVQQQNIQLAAQVQDFAVQVAGGQNPFLALAQQGSQLHAVYGGLRPALLAITGLITAKTVAVTGLTAGLGALAIGYVQGSNQSAEFRRSLALTGGAAGLTAGSFENMIDRVKDATGKGAGYVRDMAQALVSTGRFGPAQIEEATRGATLMAAITGKTAEDVAKEWARMSDSPASYAREANKSLNFLTDRELQYIQQLEKNGKRAEAAQLLTKQMMGVYTKDVAEDLGYLQRLAAGAGAAFSSMWDSLLGWGREESIDEQIAKLEQIAGMGNRKLVPGQAGGGLTSETQNQLDNLRETKRLLQRSADTKADRAAEERAKTEKREQEEKLANDRKSAAAAAEAAAKRMQAAKDALANAQGEFAAKQSILSVDAQLALLQQRRALGVDKTDDAKRLTSEAIAKLELAKIDAQAVQLADELARARARANSTTAEGVQAQAQVVQLQAQQLELDAQRGVVVRQLATDVNQIDAAAAQEAQRWADKLASVREATAGYQQQLELQGMSELAAQRLTEVRKIETAYQRELLELQRNLSLTEEERAERARALAAERDAQLNGYAQLHAQRYREIYDAETGVNSAVQEYLDRIQQSGTRAKEATATMLSGMEDAITRWVSTGKLGVKDLADTIIAEFVRIKVAQPFVQALTQALPGLSGTMSGTSSTGSGTMNELASLGVFANGGAFVGGVQAFANGGAFSNSVLTRPTLFTHSNGTKLGVGGEAGTEAVMPLQRDSRGRLGVIASLVGGGGGGGATVQVNVINQGGGGLEVAGQTTRQGPDGQISVDVVVRQVQDMLADNVAAGAGSLYHAMGNRFVKAGVN